MAFREALKSRWFWYSIVCLLCFAAWAIVSKLGSRGIRPETMQFYFTLGTLPVGIGVLIVRRFTLEKSVKGISYALLNGILSGAGNLALFAAYHTNGSTSVITVTTALYPMITVVLAVLILREGVTATQALGLAFAGAAIVLFSL